jgi:hypothetical protein
MFCALVYFGFRNRFRPVAHKATHGDRQGSDSGGSVRPVVDFRFVCRAGEVCALRGYDTLADDGLRLVVYGKGSKRHALGRRVRRGCAAGQVSDWPQPRSGKLLPGGFRLKHLLSAEAELTCALYSLRISTYAGTALRVNTRPTMASSVPQLTLIPRPGFWEDNKSNSAWRMSRMLKVRHD